MYYILYTRTGLGSGGEMVLHRGATGAARAPKPGKNPIMPPPPSIFQNQGKAVALPALPGTARLVCMGQISLGLAKVLKTTKI